MVHGTIRYVESPFFYQDFTGFFSLGSEEYFPLGTNHPLNPGQPPAITDGGWVQPWGVVRCLVKKQTCTNMLLFVEDSGSRSQLFKQLKVVLCLGNF